MDPGTRERIKESAVSVWIKAPVEVLLERLKRKDNRPLLKNGDPHEILTRLLAQREPVYALADITLNSENGPHAETVDRVIAMLSERGVWGQA